jgi:hypothetical protein
MKLYRDGVGNEKVLISSRSIVQFGSILNRVKKHKRMFNKVHVEDEYSMASC